MAKIFYYLLLKPLSSLPLSVLYILSDFLYLVLYRLAGYKKKIVLTNLKNSFPEKPAREIEAIAGRFYHHFCDVIVESIRLFSMPREEILRRARVKNPELLEKFYKEGKSLVIAAGHYNNWELVAVGISPQISHQLVGIYNPLKSPFFNRVLQKSRGRLGMVLWPKKESKARFAETPARPLGILFGTDQSPSNPNRAYWTNFLNQDTAVFYGTEKYARDYNYPVIWGWVSKVGRGYYEMEFEVIEESPASSPYGAISEAHTRLLEEEIKAAPEYWLWTHKRWKRKRPVDLS